MSFDRAELSGFVADHGLCTRVVVLSDRGSVPRGAGTAMLVSDDAVHGTIGGGALEYEAIDLARKFLTSAATSQLLKRPLGPALGQCCGGAVHLLMERFDATSLPGDTPHYLRRVSPDAPERAPAALRRALKNSGTKPGAPQMIGGWVGEAMTTAQTPLWIWGAGHVGRAMANVLAPLPDFAVTMVDFDLTRLPDPMTADVTPLIAAQPAALVPHAPLDAHHLIVTHSHALDLDLCHGLLDHGFASLGLIGSATKWARFRRRLTSLGHAPQQISRIRCPIGAPHLGKHPAQIAAGVAVELLEFEKQAPSERATGEIAS